MTVLSRKLAISKCRWADLRIDAIDFARAWKMLVDPYRPELHYMRGPGPKWHAKHDRPAAADISALAGLAHIEG
jgi:hypothetical protein